MSEIAFRIEQLKNELEEYSLENEDTAYILYRLRTIREELKKIDKAFETQNICKIIDVNKSTFVKLESGNVLPNYKSIIKLIHLYSLMGYNPMWIITKENFFLDKKKTSTELILNKSTVENAVSKFIKATKEINKLHDTALTEFENDIKN